MSLKRVLYVVFVIVVAGASALAGQFHKSDKTIADIIMNVFISTSADYSISYCLIVFSSFTLKYSFKSEQGLFVVFAGIGNRRLHADAKSIVF